MHRHLCLGDNRVWLADDGTWLRTTFPDGSHLDASVNYDAEAYHWAREFGYGTDTASMFREHEVAHTFLALKLHLPYSPTLYHTAHPETAEVSTKRRLAEEALVADFQRLCNDPEYDSHTFACLKVMGHEMQTLREEFLRLVR